MTLIRFKAFFLRVHSFNNFSSSFVQQIKLLVKVVLIFGLLKENKTKQKNSIKVRDFSNDFFY